MNYDFNSIAGYKTEKEELKRLCEIFNNRKKYERKGAKLPKGIIFCGEAGNGKTLFSKVLASVCGLEVLKIDLGDVENETAICRHIKKTFITASKKKEPTMIFFDEVDKVLPNDDEEYYTDRSKTILTQLLTLIDGMDSSNNIVFVATCNYYSHLPETLTRPGRLDKKMYIGYPDYFSRVEILEMYANQTTCTFEISMKEIAKITSGFASSGLEVLINECVLRSDENEFVSKDLILEKISEINNQDIPRERSKINDTVQACKNVGSFIVASAFNLQSGTLNLDSNSVGNDYFNGMLESIDCDYDIFDEDDEWDEDDEYDEDDSDDDENEETSHSIFNKDDYLNCIMVLLGGYVAEEVAFNTVYDNVEDNVHAINNIFNKMFNNGMFGIDAIYSLARAENMPYTSEHLNKINSIFDEVINECYSKAKDIMLKNKFLLEEMMNILVNERIISANECERILVDLGGIKK